MIDELSAIAIAAANRADLWCRISQFRGVRRTAEVGVWRGDFAKREHRVVLDNRPVAAPRA
jgi:hypothetical protein